MPRLSGQGAVLLRDELHRLQFVGQDTQDLVKLVVALLPVGRRAALTPQQPQGELSAEGLQQLGNRLPTSWWTTAEGTWKQNVREGELFK